MTSGWSLVSSLSAWLLIACKPAGVIHRWPETHSRIRAFCKAASRRMISPIRPGAWSENPAYSRRERQIYPGGFKNKCGITAILLVTRCAWLIVIGFARS